jgi:hypothetical protein
MSNNHSILWSDSTLDRDRILVKYFVENIVVGKSRPDHYDLCIEKIMRKIQTDEWQATYPYRTHIFSIYYGISIKSVVEVKFALNAQALELFYFNITNTSDRMRFDPEAGFHQKLKVVFHEIYKWNMPLDTAHAIRILRNDVMHTGTIAGVVGAYRNSADPAKLDRLFEKYEFNKNQQNTNMQNRMHLAHMFNLLLEDMLIRSLGLDQDDLAMNGTPPWHPDIFGYDHDSRPDWLREL